jgi:plasminogen activator inhibitor 1 RNA-binding protein
VDKRDGAGAHNWGSHKQDLDDITKSNADYLTDGEHKDGEEQNGNANTNSDSNENQANAEDEVREMTLDEWRAKNQATRAKPQYNLRKAGEGEDQTQWKKMVALDKKKVN